MLEQQMIMHGKVLLLLLLHEMGGGVSVLQVVSNILQFLEKPMFLLCSFFSVRCGGQRQEKEWRHATSEQCVPKAIPMPRLSLGQVEFFISPIISIPVCVCVSGASIDINCETNGDIDAMDCSWESTQWTEPQFQYR